jgi:hypothetical protein
MQTGSSETLIGWKTGQTTYLPLWDRRSYAYYSPCLSWPTTLIPDGSSRPCPSGPKGTTPPHTSGPNFQVVLIQVTPKVHVDLCGDNMCFGSTCHREVMNIGASCRKVEMYRDELK